MDGGTITAPGQGTRVAATRGTGSRILAIGNMYPPHHAGGYELMWQAAMRQAAGAGHRVRILTTDYRADAGRPEDDADVHRTLRWYWDLDRYEFPDLTLAGRLAVERHNRGELRRHVREFDPDVVSFWSMGCMSLSLVEQVRRMGIPAAFVVHDDWLVYGRQHDRVDQAVAGAAPAAGARGPADLQASPRRCGSTATSCSTPATRSSARGGSASTRPRRSSTPELTSGSWRPATGSPGAWRLAYVGRIDRQKGIDTAVRALARLPASATLAVWGTGDDRYVAELRELAARLGVGDRVRFKGFVSAAELPSMYARADTVVFPVRWEEPFGLVPLEAMGVGRPVISTARGEHRRSSLRAGENALVFAVDDDVGLADCVHRLADDPSLRERLREAGALTAAQYTVERFARLTVEEIVRTAR